METRKRHAVRFAGAWGALFALMGLWAIATPIGASPDEPAHLIKAASVVRGEFIGERGLAGEIVDVPNYIGYTHAQTCYAFDETVTADCIPDVPGDPAEIVDASTTAGLYNPLYYVLVGWPSLISTDSSGVFAMRLVSAALVSLTLAASAMIVMSWRRGAFLTVGILAAVTPMVLFLGGTVNPNSLEIGATLLAFVAVVGIARAPTAKRMWPLAMVVAGASAVAANMRGLSLLWLAIALVAPLLTLQAAQFRALLTRRSIQVMISGIVLSAVLAAAWLVSTNSLGAAVDDPGPVTNAPGVGTPAIFGFIWTLVATVEYSQGIIGIFGWLDTPAPLLVYAVWAALFAVLIVGAFVVGRVRRLLPVVVLLAAVLLLPPTLQALYITEGGVIWQGRYILPLVVCLVIASALVLDDAVELAPPMSRRLVLIAIAAWSIAQFQSFATAIRRYSTGLDEGWLGMLSPQWEPPGGIPLLVLGFALALTVKATVTWRFGLGSRSTAPNTSVVLQILDHRAP